MSPFAPLVSATLAALYTGHLVTTGLQARAWWRLPPGLRARAAGSFHRFGPRLRAVLGGLALGAAILQGLQAGGAGWASLLLAASLTATLPVLGTEQRLVDLYREAAGVERDRDFIALQARWDRWHSLQLTLAAGSLAALLLGGA